MVHVVECCCCCYGWCNRKSRCRSSLRFITFGTWNSWLGLSWQEIPFEYCSREKDNDIIHSTIIFILFFIPMRYTTMRFHSLFVRYTCISSYILLCTRCVAVAIGYLLLFYCFYNSNVKTQFANSFNGHRRSVPITIHEWQFICLFFDFSNAISASNHCQAMRFSINFLSKSPFAVTTTTTLQLTFIVSMQREGFSWRRIQ